MNEKNRIVTRTVCIASHTSAILITLWTIKYLGECHYPTSEEVGLLVLMIHTINLTALFFIMKHFAPTGTPINHPHRMWLVHLFLISAALPL